MFKPAGKKRQQWCGISIYRYKELQAFCLQYAEKQKRITAGAKKREAQRLQRDLDLIEETAKEAGGEVYSWLLVNVTTGTKYADLSRDLGAVPLPKREFDERRQLFFLKMDNRRAI